MRLIDGDTLAARIMMDAPDFLDGGSSITKAFILAMLNTRSVTPTVDAVPVIRCKDCWKYVDIHCSCYELAKDENWFCADGERRKEEE